MNEVSSRLVEMKNPAIFMQLPFEYVETAMSRMQTIDVTAGDLIISQGDEANSFYLIESGQAEVIQQGIFDSVPSRVAVLGAGDHFGEEALIHGGARNATIRMLENGRLLSLHKDDFTRLIGDELVQNISAEEALEDTEQEAAVFLDVRYEEEYYDAHLKGAKLISLPELRGRLDELDRATRYITCCNSTRRSSVAAMLLNKEGHQAVYLKGGIRAWPFEVIDEMALND
jgi:rhodanese-related sulfurtransferase